MIIFLFVDIADNSFELSTMFNSMNASMLIAQECLKNEPEEDTTYLGLENFAAAIDSSRRKKNNGEDLFFNQTNFSFLVLARVRVTLTDTVIRLEHMIDNTDQGVALEIRIKK